MKQWKYRHLAKDTWGTKDGANEMRESSNMLGRLGWEMVSMDNQNIWFKKPLEKD